MNNNEFRHFAQSGSPRFRSFAFVEPHRASIIFIAVCAMYFLLQILIRLHLSEALDLDEAEQVFLSQHLQLGYDTQPPLYAWLQFASFSLFGINLLALSLLKNALLLTSYLSLFLVARPMLGELGAAAVAASMLMLPAIGWESQRDLTHSVLLLTMASVTLLSYFSLLKRPDSLRYALFGIALALGMLSKYNFAMFATGLTIAGLTVREHRAVLWNRKLIITAAAGLIVFAPHLWWLLQHLHEAANGTLAKMGQGAQSNYLLNVLTGLASVGEGVISFVTPLWLVYAWTCRREIKSLKLSDSVHARFFLIMLACFAGLVAVMLLTGKVTNLKSRWMIPLLFFTPLVFFVVFPQCANRLVYRRVLQWSVGFAVLVVFALPLRIYIGPMLGKQVRAHFPYPELSDALAAKFPKVGIVFSDAQLTAGNLHFQRTDLRTALLNDIDREKIASGQQVLVLFDAGSNDNWRASFAAAYPTAREQQRGSIELKMNYGLRNAMNLQYVQFDLGK